MAHRNLVSFEKLYVPSNFPFMCPLFHYRAASRMPLTHLCHAFPIFLGTYSFLSCWMFIWAILARSDTIFFSNASCWVKCGVYLRSHLIHCPLIAWIIGAFHFFLIPCFPHLKLLIILLAMMIFSAGLQANVVMTAIAWLQPSRLILNINRASMKMI